MTGATSVIEVLLAGAGSWVGAFFVARAVSKTEPLIFSAGLFIAFAGTGCFVPVEVLVANLLHRTFALASIGVLNVVLLTDFFGALALAGFLVENRFRAIAGRGGFALASAGRIGEPFFA